MTEYNAFFRGDSLKESFPEAVTIDDFNTLLFKDAKLIFTEFDKSADPITFAPWNKGFYVGLKVTAAVRTFAQEGEGTYSLTEKPQQYGEITALPEDATLKEVVEVINELVAKIRDQIVGKPCEA